MTDLTPERRDESDVTQSIQGRCPRMMEHVYRVNPLPMPCADCYSVRVTAERLPDWQPEVRWQRAEQFADFDARDEWAVEVTWRDWKKAGAKGPTSQYGPFDTPEWRDRFLGQQRRDRDVTATRVLKRRAHYTPWVGPDAPEPTTEKEREALLRAEWERINNRNLTRRLGFGYAAHPESEGDE